MRPRYLGVIISSISQTILGVYLIWATTLNPIELGTAIDKNLLTNKLISKAWLEAKTKYVINKACMTLEDMYTYDEMKKVLKN